MASVKMSVLWGVALRSLVDPDDGGNRHLRNVGKFVPDY